LLCVYFNPDDGTTAVRTSDFHRNTVIRTELLYSIQKMELRSTDSPGLLILKRWNLNAFQNS
jgi:hypothetical protein